MFAMQVKKLVFSAVVVGFSLLAMAEDTPEATPPATTAPAAAGPAPRTLSVQEARAAVKAETGVEVGTVFATRCAACHLGNGLQKGDGPMLAGTSLDLGRIIERIVKGKTPMPAFSGQISNEHMFALARYIELLKPPGQ